MSYTNTVDLGSKKKDDLMVFFFPASLVLLYEPVSGTPGFANTLKCHELVVAKGEYVDFMRLFLSSFHA